MCRKKEGICGVEVRTLLNESNHDFGSNVAKKEEEEEEEEEEGGQELAAVAATEEEAKVVVGFII